MLINFSDGFANRGDGVGLNTGTGGDACLAPVGDGDGAGFYRSWFLFASQVPRNLGSGEGEGRFHGWPYGDGIGLVC
jgi:hypothetical protein